MFFYTCASCGASVYSSANAATVGACPGCSDPLTDTYGADTRASAEAPTRTDDSNEVRAADLGRALIEQARLGDEYARLVGTSAEQSAFARLQHAGHEVVRCDQDVRDDRDQDASTPS